MMPSFTASVPVWVSILFLLAIPAPAILVTRLLRQGAGSGVARPVRVRFVVFCSAYLLYVTLGTWGGLFLETRVPPRILLFSTIPFLLFLLGVIFWQPLYQRILRNTSYSDLIRVHRFRLVGGFFLVLAWYDAVPPVLGIIAGTGDVIAALSSFWVARLVKNNAPRARSWVLAWNTFGLLDILATAGMANYFSWVYLQTGMASVEVLAEFPFSYIPAIAPPVIIFLHASLYWKLFREGI